MKGRYFRLDAYENRRMIVSLKSGQYGGGDAASARRLLNAVDELKAKYDVRRVIADVPSTPSMLKGEPLRGRRVLGIPVQTDPIPSEVLHAASRAGVRIMEIDIPVVKLTGRTP